MSKPDGVMRMEFAERLQLLMARKHLTKVDLVLATGVTINCAERWMRGDNYPTVNNLRPIKELLGCTWDELMDGVIE